MNWHRSNDHCHSLAQKLLLFSITFRMNSKPFTLVLKYFYYLTLEYQIFFSSLFPWWGKKKEKHTFLHKVYVPVRRKDSKQKVKHQWLYGSKYYEEKLDREGIYGKVDVINKDATFEQDLKGVREWVTWTYEIKVAGRSIANIKTLSGPMTEVVSFISCFLGVGSIIILQCCVAAAAAESL